MTVRLAVLILAVLVGACNREKPAAETAATATNERAVIAKADADVRAAEQAVVPATQAK